VIFVPYYSASRFPVKCSLRGFGIGPIKSNSSGFASNNSFFDSTDLKDEKAIRINITRDCNSFGILGSNDKDYECLL
jgi:hypothetical protein